MGNLLRTGADWLAAQRHAHCSTTATYTRASDEVELSATIGHTKFEVADEHGVVTNVQSRDFLIRTADLVLATAATEPVRGDIIKETSGSDVLLYQVMAPENEPCWRYADEGRATMRVHTKFVGTE